VAEKQKAVFSVQLDNDRTIVREWRFATGSETGWHCHENEFIVVPQTEGVLLLQTKAGESKRGLEPGCSYFRKAGIEHNAVNDGEDEIVLLEIELKS
jgi:quercetin dioxygenase-like cupin family protein